MSEICPEVEIISFTGVLNKSICKGPSTPISVTSGLVKLYVSFHCFHPSKEGPYQRKKYFCGWGTDFSTVLLTAVALFSFQGCESVYGSVSGLKSHLGTCTLVCTISIQSFSLMHSYCYCSVHTCISESLACWIPVCQCS